MDLFDSFIVRAALGGIGVALVAAPLGCFVVWRRMAYFGDATAHAAILGVALSLALDASVFIGALGVALCMAVSVSVLRGRGYPMDTLLGVVSGVRVDLNAYLFGDILAVSQADLVVIWSGVVFVMVLLLWRWQRLLITTVNEDLAQAAGVDPRTEQWVLTLALAIVVAVAIKVVGALLIGALLLIPAATARRLSTTPEAMALTAMLIGVFGASSGLAVSWQFDTPSGPTIVCVVAVLFLVSTFFPSQVASE